MHNNIIQLSYSTSIGIIIIGIIIQMVLYSVLDLSRTKYKRAQCCLLFFTFVSMFFLMSFRTNAFDDNSYYWFFYDIPSYGHSLVYKGIPEPGYQFLNYIIYYMTGDYYYMKIAVGLITNSLLFVFFNRILQSGKNSLVLSGYICTTFFYYLGLYRMAIAVSLFYNAYLYYTRKNIKKFCFLTILAGLFHYSAWLMLLFPLAKKIIKHIQKNFKGNFVLSIFAIMLIEITLIFILNILFSKGSVIPFFSRYISYSTFQFNISTLKNCAYVLPLIIIGGVIANKLSLDDQNELIILFSVTFFLTFFTFFRIILYMTPIIFRGYIKVGECLTKGIRSRILYGAMINIFLIIFLYVLFLDSPYIGGTFIPLSFTL